MLSHYTYLLVVQAVGNLNVNTTDMAGTIFWGTFFKLWFREYSAVEFFFLHEPNLTGLQALDAGCALVLN